jgi:hypothetical protein
MPKPFLLCVLMAGCVPFFAGCGGESKETMFRRMKEQRDLIEANDGKAGGSAPDPDSGIVSSSTAGVTGTKAGSALQDPDGGTASAPKAATTGTPASGKTSPASKDFSLNIPSAETQSADKPSPTSTNTKAKTAPTAAVVPISTPSVPLSATATPEERRARTIENLAKLGKALNAYSDRNAGYPETKNVDSRVYPRMSWRVAILPLLGYEKLFQQYQPNEPWDSESNKQVLAQIPPEYQSADRRDSKTNYLVPLSSRAAFGGALGRLNRSSFDDPLDGTLLLLAVDDSHAVEWTRPDDLSLQMTPGSSLRSQLGSLAIDGFLAVLANGRVCRIKPNADELALQALFTVSGEDTHHIKDAIQDATAVVADVPKVVGGTSTTAPASAKGVPSVADDEPASTPKTVKPLTPLVNKKLAVPTESELSTARATIKKIYAEEYKQAKSTEDRRKLAQKLLANSHEVGEDHIAEYELLRISRDLFAQNGELAQALKANSQLELRFEINIPRMRLETFKLFQKSPDALMKDKELAKEAKQLVRLAVDQDEFDVALDAIAIQKGSAKRSEETEALSKIGKTQTWLEAAKVAYHEVAKAEARLVANPSDPQANQIVGIYTCLVKGRWELGLPQLAKATDLKYRFLAKLDLTSAKSAQEIVDLANQYWDLAEQKPNLEEKGLKLRAAYWYSQAARQLPDGLEKIKARKRLAEIVETYGKEDSERAIGSSVVATVPASGVSDE